ncbi:MAG TPA: tetratricopeptide repeat protein [Candidatus Dormibacteraeota bacterium]|nr:tetratricopeptide repeat protein [Candidatus Dormibacteraeota bacterium]
MAEIPERVKPRLELVEEAIAAALDADWQTALALNMEIVERFGADEEVNNRLGKVYTELRKLDDALASYRATLELNPLNGIALKNVNRLEALIQEKTAAPTTKSAVDVNLFVEEMGKTALASVHLDKGLDSALVAPGDQVEVAQEGSDLVVKTSNGQRFGRVEAKLARRVMKFMAGGNRYAGAIATADDKGVRIILRETYQAPELAGQPSFPVRKGQEFRSYAKDILLRDNDLEGLAGDDDEDDDGGGADGDDELDGMHAVEPGMEDASDFNDDNNGDDNY